MFERIRKYPLTQAYIIVCLTGILILSILDFLVWKG